MSTPLQRKQKAAATCAKKCRAAADSIAAYAHACRELADGSAIKGNDDQRLTFMRDLRDYAEFLDMRSGVRQ